MEPIPLDEFCVLLTRFDARAKDLFGSVEDELKEKLFLPVVIFPCSMISGPVLNDTIFLGRQRYSLRLQTHR